MNVTLLNTYLCGGINGFSDSDCNNWRTVAKGYLLTQPIDPIRRDYRGMEDDNVEAIVKGDLMDLLHSPFVLVNATRPSCSTPTRSSAPDRGLRRRRPDLSLAALPFRRHLPE